jgi:DNA-directed RNA polymerase specialized sigma24 family protein
MTAHVDGVRVENRERVREVYVISAGRLVAQMFALTGDVAVAQDVVQEALVWALAGSAGYARWTVC